MTDLQPTECANAERIRALNDALRTRQSPIGSLIASGDLVITRGVADKGTEFVTRAVHAVRTFSDFSPDNDPHGEHDGSVPC